MLARTTLSLPLLFLGALPSHLPAAEAPPNIAVVLIDDLGWGDWSCFGNTAVETEHVDRLAAEGLRFSQFYVNSPICSPSRVALATGQFPHRWRITSYLSNRAENERRGLAQWLDPAAPSLARLLQQAGYATGHFGKWHMGGQRDVGEAPLISEYGFDQSLTNFEGLGPRVLPLCDAHDGRPPRKHALGSDALGRGPIHWQDRAKVTESFAGAALEFIRKAADNGQPFYINLGPDDVHSPFFPPAARRGDGAKRTLYHGVLDTMDEQLGVLFDHIRGDERLRNNTLILVCSDNGPEPGAGSAGPFRGTKTMLYEGGIRSPLIVWGPGLIPVDKASRLNETSVFSAIDLVPSLLALAGVKPPAEVAFDGENVLDTLLGKSPASRQAPLFWRRPPDRKSWPQLGVPAQPDLAIRDGNWKLLCDYDGSSPELYDLAADRAETTNRAADRPEVVNRLTAAVVAWHKSLPADNGPTYDRPNILWITSEDNSPYLGCYGDKLAHTPHLDRLAAQGVRYRHAFANAPVCSTARTTLITGMYATTLGVQHHRSRVRIPDGFRLYPEHLRAAGYYCTNNSKTDYNVANAGQPWDESSNRAHYRNRRPGQPFFAVFNFTTSHESRVAPKQDGETFRVPPEDIVLPPYHPDTPEIRRDWANYYDQMTALDEQVGAVLAELEQEGLADDTIVFYYSDHGGALPRGKRNVHDSGTRVPLIIRFPKRFAQLAPAAPGEWVDEPISFVDFPATVFNLCGVPIPVHYEGRAFLGPERGAPRQHVFLYRGRMDE
ncbi:MAG TPA: sulfatase-like hydrolase/transferase, partial [Planctomycetaceae bacterium]|nr:sulfatase-like hydrolase/transferase [Planctomycetaceae bacterium]